jgi:hypothetical protein
MTRSRALEPTNKMSDFQTGKSSAGREICSLENEIEKEIRAKSKLLCQTPNRADIALLEACYTAFEVHCITP